MKEQMFEILLKYIKDDNAAMSARKELLNLFSVSGLLLVDDDKLDKWIANLEKMRETSYLDISKLELSGQIHLLNFIKDKCNNR